MVFVPLQFNLMEPKGSERVDSERVVDKRVIRTK